MNILKLKLFELLKTNNAKVLFLAGLIGLASSCNVDEPEFSGNFMQNMPVSDVKNAVFYQPGEDTQNFSFQTDNNTVTGVTFVKDVKDRNTEIYNPVNLKRTYTKSRNNHAHFISSELFEYITAPKPGVSWGIHNVTNEEYYSKYKNMSDQKLADLAKNRIQSKNPEATDYATKIYDGILARKGFWRQNRSFRMVFDSRGKEQNLKSSDFGIIYSIITQGGFPNLSYEDTVYSLYSGGVYSNEVDKSVIQPQTFNITAVGYFGSNRMETGHNAATLTIDHEGGETIVMPFKDSNLNNWYTVTIRITKEDSVLSEFKDENGTISPELQFSLPHIPETEYHEVIQDNNLRVKFGSGIFITTRISVNYYTDETGNIEVSGQGDKIERYGNPEHEFKFVLGGANRQR